METVDTNPYASPSDLAAAPDLSALYYRDGKFLVVRDGAELPLVCIVTHEPVAENGWRKKVSIAWTPPWVFLTIILNILVLLIVMLVFQKKAKITYSLGKKARSKIVRKRLSGWLLFALAIGLIVLGIDHSDSSPMLFIGGFLTLIVALVFFIIANPIKAVKFHDGWFRLKGCSKDFLDTLPVFPSTF